MKGCYWYAVPVIVASAAPFDKQQEVDVSDEDSTI